MDKLKLIEEISARYAELTDSISCLSCGRAINYANPNSGDFCVDLGSGRGTDVFSIAEKVGSQGFVFGIDASDKMISKATQTAKQNKILNVKFIHSEFTNIPLESGKTDLVVSNCAINHADNKQEVWNEIYRILKINGRFAISDIYSKKKIPDQYKNDPVSVAECWAGAVTKDDYITHILKAGFREFEIVEESKPYTKGKAYICSITIVGKKTKNCCCCC